MAFLSQKGLFLAPKEDSNVLAFSAPPRSDSSKWAVVAFHSVTGKKVKDTPTQYLCPGKEYALKVLVPEVKPQPQPQPQPQPVNSGLIPLRPSRRCSRQRTTQITTNSVRAETPKEMIGFLVANPKDPNTFLLKESVPPRGLVLFQPAPDLTIITINAAFNATLSDDTGNAPKTDEFVVQPSPSKENAAKLGYTTPFPSLLSNCKACGCPSNQRCTTTGHCEANPPTVCPPNAVCGALNGKCFGSCGVNGMECRNINGEFRCVPVESGTEYFKIILIIILIAFIAVALYFIIYAIYNANRPKEVGPTELVPILGEGEHGTVAIGREVY